MINDTKRKAIRLSTWIHWLIENTGFNLKMTASIPKQTDFKPIPYKDVSYYGNQTNDLYTQREYTKSNIRFYNAVNYEVSKYLHDNSDLADKLHLLSGIEYYKKLVTQYIIRHKSIANFSKKIQNFQNKHCYLEANIYKEHEKITSHPKDNRIASRMPIKWGTIIKRLNAFVNDKGIYSTPEEDLVGELHFLQRSLKKDAAKPSSYEFGFHNFDVNLNANIYNSHNDYYRYLCQHPILSKFLRIKPINNEFLIAVRNNSNIKLTHSEFNQLLSLASHRIPEKFITKHAKKVKKRRMKYYLRKFKKFVSKIPDDDFKYDAWPMLKANFNYISKLEYKKNNYIDKK